MFGSFRIEKQTRHAIYFHLSIAIFLFSPIFLGKVFIGSTDNQQNIFPNILFSLDALKQGSLGHWNPYLLGGIDFASSTHNYILAPLNWPLFLLPSSWFLHLQSIRVFFEVFLFGFTAYLFLREELQDETWALVSSVIFQTSGYLFFTLTTYSHTQLVVFLMFGLYTFWTFHRRSSRANFLLLTAVVVLLTVSGNIVYCLTSLLIMGCASLYRAFSLPTRSRVVSLGTIAAAGISGALLAAPRWLPVIHSLLFEGGRARAMDAGFPLSESHFYMIFSGLIPETMGVHYSHSQWLIRALNPSDGGHAQFHGLPYFGVIGITLVIFSFLAERTKAHTFWLVWVALSGLWLLAVPPFHSMMDLLAVPLVHTIVPKMVFSIGMAPLLGHALLALSKQARQIENKIPWLWTWLGVLATICLMLWLHQRGIGTSSRRLLLLMALASTAALSFMLKKTSRWFWPSVIGLASLILITLSNFQIPLKEIWRFDSFRTTLRSDVASSLGAAALCLWIFIRTKRDDLKTPIFKILSAVLAVLLIINLPAADLSQGYHPISSGRDELYAIFLLGLVKYLFLAAALVWILKLHARGSKMALPIVLLAFSLIDLLPYNNNYRRQVTEPFTSVRDAYPEIRRASVKSESSGTRDFLGRSLNTNLDIMNYRVNRPEWITDLTMHGLVDTNISSVYRLRTYSGANSDLSAGFMSLLRTFNLQLNAGAANIAASEAHPTLLDLFGCRYDFQNDQVIERPTALSRFMFYGTALALDERATRQALQASGFEAKRALFLAPGSSIVQSDESSAESVSYESLAPDHLRVKVTAPRDGFVFFGDNYHAHWHATVDQKPGVIQRAFVNFMAIPVKAGTHEIDLKFTPKFFDIGCKLLIIGLLLTGLLALIINKATPDEFQRR